MASDSERPARPSDEEIAATVGTVSWTEIPVVSLSNAAAFYKSVFGWSTNEAPKPESKECSSTKDTSSSKTPEPPITAGHADMLMWSKAKTSSHGCFVRVEKEELLTAASNPANRRKAAVAVTVTITVEDIDEALAKIAENGGQVWMPKMKLPNNMGYIAKFLDIDSNVFALWAMKDKSETG